MKSVVAMLAVDTNVVVRYLVKDDDAQSARARDIVQNAPIFISPTVILECDWVLRSLYGFSRRQALGALEAFFGTPNVNVGEAAAVKRALRLAELGLDFADALQLALAEYCEAFVTFDRRLARRARGLIDTPVRLA